MTAEWLEVSLRARIMLLATAVVGALLWGGGVFLVRDSGAALRRSLDAQVAVIAQDAAAQIRDGAAPVQVILQPLDGPFPQPALQVRETDGTLVAALTDGVALQLSGAQPAGGALALAPVRDGEPPVPRLHELVRDQGWSVSRTDAEAGSGRSFVVWAGAPYTAVESVLDPLELRLRVAVPFLAIVTGALSYVLVGRALRPVERIRSEAESVTDSSLSRRVPEPRTNDEVGRLARTFNRMLGRLETAQHRQRQFVSDASHELRNPVAILRASLEVAKAHPESTDWNRTVDELLVVTGRLESLVDDLLLLARQRELDSPSASDEVDFDDVVRQEVRIRSGSPIVVVSAQAARVLGSRRDLVRVVSNLLDNACRSAVSAIEVRLRAEGTTAVLWVDDDGPGVPDRDRQRIFERFVRLDQGRGRSGGGAGLGLAVVGETVAAHGGTATVEDSELGGARFVITLPLAG